MNPMQGPRNTSGSSTGANQEDGESIYSTDTSLNNMLNPVDNEFPNNSTPSGRPTYASSSSHAAQNHNWWRFGESSSIPSFLHGSSSSPMSQHVNMSMDMDIDGFGAQTSGVVIRHNDCGGSSGTSIQAAGERSSGPGSSLGGWGSSCKRKAPGGAPSHSFSGETPDCFVQTGNGTSHGGLTQYGASSSLSLATLSQSSPVVTNHFGQPEQMFRSGGGRAVASNAFHSTRNTDTIPRPGRRLNPRQPQESVAFSISHARSSLQQNSPLNSPFVDPLDMRSASVTGGSSTDENRTNIVHLPALTRNIHQFAWDSSFNPRASNTPGIGIPAERFGPQWETLRTNSEQPMFAPASETASQTRNTVHDQSIWSFTRGNPGSSIGSPFVPRAGPSSASHVVQPNPTWIPPQSAPLHNPSRVSELSPWSLFPSIESRSANHGASLPLLPTGPTISSNEVAIPSGSNSRSHRSRQRRSGLLSDRRNDLLRLRHLWRSLAAGSDGRNQLSSEIRQVLNAWRRGENLRLEDHIVFDPHFYQGMNDRHWGMRLEIDHMSYEELLALEERMGNVSTGVKEEVVLKAMKQHKHTSPAAELHQDIKPCCICQEDYAEGDDLGTLECGHEFHKDCIKQWVILKNRCPMCKTKALKTS